ncbi:hypothetical protein [Campylobacter devanensis]|uniref:hypothetical protein n=1 Tax=Campylobacter devanensis TaxID=3161138 RepID=UPI000A34E190|nr:hypothetical protein [Campylobacter sp. P0136]
MGTRKFEKLILSSAKSKNNIVAEALAEIRKYEAKDPANDYICSVIHAYDNGDNAGDQYIVINEKLRVEYGLKSNAVASSHYSSADIKAMIDEVDAKIPLDPAKKALLKEVEAIEADIRAKEAQLPPKEKELRNLKQQKATIEQEIADLNSLIAQARAEGRSTTVLEASKAQREAELATKNRQISTLEGQINEIKRQIPLLKEQAKNKQTQQEAIKSPELATKAYVDGINTTLTRSINTKANSNAVVALTGNQTIAGNKTLSGATTLAATVINGATQLKGAVTATGAITSSGNVTFNTGQVTFNNKAPISTVAPTVANHLATKAYVDGINTTLTGSINTKANANATVNLTGNQTIAGIKTFSSPVVVPNATANTHAVNLAQLNTKANANATVNLTGNQTIAGNKTLSGTTTLAATVINGATQLKGAVTATGAVTSSGNVTFNTGQVTFNNKAPICSIAPTAANHLVTKDYVDKKAKAYIIETYNNTSTGSWYRVWSDKWCEQGGFAPNTTIRHDTVTLLKPYKDTKYCIYTSHMGGKWEAWWASDETITDVTTNSFKMNSQKNNTATCRNWKTCGYIA